MTSTPPAARATGCPDTGSLVVRPRLVASDLDGTLLRDDATLSERTRAALRLARAIGVRVVAATARAPRVVTRLFGGDGRSGPLIDAAVCVNGAARYDLVSGRIDIRHELHRDLAAAVIDEVTRRIPGAGFAVETGTRELVGPGYRYRPAIDRVRVPVATTADLLAGPLVKLMVWLPDGDPDAAWATLRPTLGGLVSCTWASLTALLEIAAPGVSKASCLAELCADWHVDPAEVLAFGDGPNDLSMLGWAGTAYAVANAHPAVLTATVNHTASNEDHGVARVLEKLYG